MKLIKKYFPDLTKQQIDIFEHLYDSYKYWNEKINVISRKDFHNFYKHHVLHSMAIAKFTDFKEETQILDVGTGGGFPGLPLAILFPSCQFVLADSIRKKLKVINAIKEDFKLDNVSTMHTRIEKYHEKFDFVMSRAVTKFPLFVKWTSKNITSDNKNKLINGIIYLKGGDMENEIAPFRDRIIMHPIKNDFQEDFFETKKILYLPIAHIK
jgi:16S rRNA (guanine527-N7)-methyltransferase